MGRPPSARLLPRQRSRFRNDPLSVRVTKIVLAMPGEALHSRNDSLSRLPMAKKPAAKSTAKAKSAAKAKPAAKAATKKTAKKK